jgi:8-oxo-dGTP diphosphatase
MKRRSAVVLVQDGRVALIRRRRADAVYYLFPGGGVEEGETDEAAASREACEELGVDVRVGRLLGTVTRDQSIQLYFDAEITGGEFGTGTGEEMASSAVSDRGSYEPVWMSVTQLDAHDVRPWDLAKVLAEGRLPDQPLEFVG